MALGFSHSCSKSAASFPINLNFAFAGNSVWGRVYWTRLQLWISAEVYQRRTAAFCRLPALADAASRGNWTARLFQPTSNFSDHRWRRPHKVRHSFTCDIFPAFLSHCWILLCRGARTRDVLETIYSHTHTHVHIHSQWPTDATRDCGFITP